MADTPVKAIGYLRASTNRQELGPEAQRRSILRWAEANHIDVVNFCSDQGFSGSLPLERRPGLTEAVELIKQGEAAFLIVDVCDRLARDLLNALLIEAHLRDARSRVLFTDGSVNGDSPTQVATRQIRYVFAELERSDNRARVQAAMQLKRSRNEMTGTPPLGFYRGPQGILLPYPPEQQLIWAVASMRRRGFGYLSIAYDLKRWGYQSRPGGPTDKRVYYRLVRDICIRLSIVRNHRYGEAVLPRPHRCLLRQPVWDAYVRALKEAQRMHPAEAPRHRGRAPLKSGGPSSWPSWTPEATPQTPHPRLGHWTDARETAQATCPDAVDP